MIRSSGLGTQVPTSSKKTPEPEIRRPGPHPCFEPASCTHLQPYLSKRFPRLVAQIHRASPRRVSPWSRQRRKPSPQP